MSAAGINLSDCLVFLFRIKTSKHVHLRCFIYIFVHPSYEETHDNKHKQINIKYIHSITLGVTVATAGILTGLLMCASVQGIL